MSFLLMPLVRCFDFEGRSRRQELARFSIVAAVAVAAAVAYDDHAGRAHAVLGQAGPLTVIVTLLLALPLAALAVRRLHDIGRSGGWAMLAAVPGIGQLWLAALLATPGTRGANRFGVDPKGHERRPAMLAH